MRFAVPHLAYSLVWIFIALVLFYVWAFRQRRRAMGRFAASGLADTLAAWDAKRYRLKVAFVILGVFMSYLSLMRPQWGFRWQEVKRVGLDIIIAIDTSKSMLAEDVKPNRLERSKLAIKDLVSKLKGDRIGLIAFSGSAFLQCPLTVDYAGFALTLDDLSVSIIPKGGTSISSAIREALSSYEGGMQKYKALIIITDGEDHEGDPLAAAKEAAKDGVKIYCIGIGTKEGELIPIRDDKGKIQFLKDRDGNTVKTHLDEKTLQEIALETGGSYVRATSSEFGLGVIYDKKLSEMERREVETKMHKSYTERFQIPLTAAFILLFFEPFITDRKRPREDEA
jgi:Ca-activated chloride channel family protein